jgi:ABC-type nickel/cobalt efflux system permease component RcnA
VIPEGAVVTTVTAAVLGVSTVGGLVSAVRLATTPTRLALWMFAIALVPLLGAWAWFEVGRPVELRTRREGPDHGPAIR